MPAIMLLSTVRPTTSSVIFIPSFGLCHEDTIKNSYPFAWETIIVYLRKNKIKYYGRKRRID